MCQAAIAKPLLAAGLSHNVLRLCVRLRSVGIVRSGSLHKTDVSCCFSI